MDLYAVQLGQRYSGLIDYEVRLHAIILRPRSVLSGGDEHGDLDEMILL